MRKIKTRAKITISDFFSVLLGAFLAVHLLIILRGLVSIL